MLGVFSGNSVSSDINWNYINNNYEEKIKELEIQQERTASEYLASAQYSNCHSQGFAKPVSSSARPASDFPQNMKSVSAYNDRPQEVTTQPRRLPGNSVIAAVDTPEQRNTINELLSIYHGKYKTPSEYLDNNELEQYAAYCSGWKVGFETASRPEPPEEMTFFSSCLSCFKTDD
ncbi:hypothetical protein JFY74_03165 [Pectobacterium carotovorum]|nr:hypothetical protein JFY74_03165 [Pectobacterium carotovorum]